MAQYLAALERQIASVPDKATLVDLLEKTNDVLLHENRDWRALILSQELHAP
jgi:hypothetical protein